MKASCRILVEVLAPPAIGGLLGWLPAFLSGPESIQVRFGWLWAALAYAYVIAIIPSVLYAAAMEFAFRRGLSVRSGATLALSSGLGALAGFGIYAVVAQNAGLAREALGPGTLMCELIGLLTGAVVALCIRAKASRESPPGLETV